MSKISYQDAGVDISAGNRAVSLMKKAVQATYGPEVLLGVGAFGGLFDISALKGMDSPTLVASTDGVGTKTKIAVQLNRFDSIGHDIVNHCLNDILAQGAKPLFFLDYVAASKLKPEMIAGIVGGIAEACQKLGCALLGGETAEMPGVYEPGEFDLVGTIVGAVDRRRIITGERIKPGDKIIGLASAGLHTNGFSLARKVFEGWDMAELRPELGSSLGEALLAPHRPYLAEVEALWQAGVEIKGLAHITGGGLIENPPRILPAGTSARLRRDSWPVPPLFSLIQQAGDIEPLEMARTFNMGLGMLVVVSAEEEGLTLQTLGANAWSVGEISAQEHKPVVILA